MKITRSVFRSENHTSKEISEGINTKFSHGHKLRGVELFTMGGKAYVDFYFEREVEDDGSCIYDYADAENMR